jgi:hypothetical protein
MRRDDPQHPIAKREIGVDRATGFPAADSEIDRAGGQHGETGENGVAETPALVTDAGSEDDPTPGRLTEISPLIGMPPGAASGINFLKAGNVRVDFTQHSGDSPGVIAPVDPDAGMNVVGHDSNREAVRRPDGLRSNAGAAVDSRPPASLGVQ